MSLFRRLVIPALLALLGACGSGSDTVTPPKPTEPPTPTPTRIETLWAETIEGYLADELWLPRDNYDAAHVLMVPMHWAFTTEQGSGFKTQFDGFFSRYAQVFEQSLDEHYLRRLQFFYLVSQYLKLSSAQSGAWNATHQQLFDGIYADIVWQWTQRELSTYGYPPFKHGMRERLTFKLNTLSPAPEYARAIFDEEFFILAIAADLIVISNQNQAAVSPELEEMQSMGYQLFVQETVLLSDGGWLFQPGVWSHYADYLYAGNEVLGPDLSEQILDDIPMDSSHFHRMPLWLISMRDGFAAATPEADYFNELLSRTAFQFAHYILKPADTDFPAPRLNNYTNGWNGVYRYNYATTGQGSGYGPYEISGTLMHSWYPFMQSWVLKTQLAELAFPLPQQVLNTYIGPNTTRERHPLVTWPAYFNNGFAELHCLLSGDMLVNYE